jgi:hypothetical protein
MATTDKKLLLMNADEISTKLTMSGINLEIENMAEVSKSKVMHCC